MVAPTSFFGDYGGHIRILEETLALQELGHQVIIVTYHMGRDLAGIDIRRPPPLPWRADYEVGSSRHKIALDIFLAAKVWREVWRERPDIIHGHMHEGALIGGSLARLLRTPLVFDFQGSLTAEMVDHGFLNPDGLFYRWLFRLERFISRRLPQAVLTSSIRARTLLEERFSVPANRIYPLPDCVDVNRFSPDLFTPDLKARLRQELAIPAGRPIVAYLGLLANYQGTGHLVRAAAYLQEWGEDVHFLIMGYPNVPRYEALARELGVADRVTFTGRMNYDLAPAYLSLGDIAVSPKVSSTEGSGKVLNYMAMAQPVAAYDSPVHREYLGEYGVYVPQNDIAGLARAIAELAADPERRSYLGCRLRQLAQEKYSWREAARQIAGLYQALLAQKKDGR